MDHWDPSSICSSAGRIQVLGKGRMGKKPVSLALEDSTNLLHGIHCTHPWRQAREELELQLDRERMSGPVKWL